MLRLSTKQLMDKSKCFTFLFWGAIVVFSLAVLLNIIWPFTSCNDYYSSCSYSYYQCTSYGTVYCCPSSYSCSSYYCYPKNNYPCPGLIIAAGVMYGLAFLMAIVVFIMFCQLKERARLGVYADSNNPTNHLIYNSPPLYVPSHQFYPPSYNPPIVYSDGNSQSNGNTGFNQPVINKSDEQ
jgi:hypothetical protein